ncbi:MAG: hypothetical protein ACFB16_12345 [Phormidesmis sp.]
MKKNIKKIKASGKHLVLLLLSVLLFSQVSNTNLPYLGREYVVLFIIQLYFVATYLVVPKLRGE